MNLTQMKNTVLAALAVAGSAVAQALGGWDVALKVLICFMALDYVTGWLVAAVWHKSAKSKTGALDSKASYKGLVKKGVMLALVWMAALLDQATHSDFVRDAVCLFFIANEGLSVLENTAVMGVPYPAFVKNMLDALHQTGDQGKGTEARTRARERAPSRSPTSNSSRSISTGSVSAPPRPTCEKCWWRRAGTLSATVPFSCGTRPRPVT